MLTHLPYSLALPRSDAKIRSWRHWIPEASGRALDPNIPTTMCPRFVGKKAGWVSNYDHVSDCWENMGKRFSIWGALMVIVISETFQALAIGSPKVILIHRSKGCVNLFLMHV